MNGDVIAVAALEMQLHGISGIDEDAVAGRDDALTIELIDAAGALKLKQQKQVVAVVEPYAADIAIDEIDVRRDLHEAQSCGRRGYDSAGHHIDIVTRERREPAADGAQPIRPVAERGAHPKVARVKTELRLQILEPHVRSSQPILKLITC